MTPSTRVRRAPSATWREIDGQVVIISLDVSRVRLLNPVGSFVWARCDGREVGALVADVRSRFDVTDEQAARDVEAFLADLRTRGMLVVES